MLPRPIYPGVTYLVTRRCIERLFLLRPSKETNEVIRYCLAIAAERTGVEIHAYCAMSNHIHSVVTDTKGRLPLFLQFLHRHIALAMSERLGRKGNLWAGEQTSIVQLTDRQSVIEKMAYVVCNPTRAGLVRSPQDWPGAISHHLGEVVQVPRPALYFRKGGELPDLESLECTLPPLLAELGMKKANILFSDALGKKVRAAREFLRGEKRSFLGTQEILKTCVTDSPRSMETRCSRIPRFSSFDFEGKKSAIAEWKAFLLAYADAFAKWRLGERLTCFPSGTWQMLRVHHAICGPPLS